MKITDPEIIKSGEKDLIDAVKDDIDLDVVKSILEKRMAASRLSASGGEIIVHNNQIAFRIDFNIELSGSLMFDRQGNHIPQTDGARDQKSLACPDQDADIDDIDIREAFDEIDTETDRDKTLSDALNMESLNESKADTDTDLTDDEELSIDLPDYSLDDEEADGLVSGADDLNRENLLDQSSLLDGEDILDDNPVNDDEDDLDLLEKKLGLADDLESMDDIVETSMSSSDTAYGDTEIPGSEFNFDEANSAEEKPGPADQSEDQSENEDISDILKESRDFWEQKK